MIYCTDFNKSPLAQFFTLPSLRYSIKFCFLFGLFFGLMQVAQAAPFTVSTDADSGGGSLRQAILDANGMAGADTITFTRALTITPLSSLPTITDQVTIDGYTAPGAAVSTGTTGNGFNGTLVVELNGSMAGDAGIGLRISAGGCLIRGLVINRFMNSGIRIDAGTGTRIFGNFIGTDLNGTAALGNFNRGILIVGSTLNQIGNSTTSTGNPVASTTNVISGNFGTGISITGGGSALIRRNLIGTDKTGIVDLGNTQEGIRIVDSSGSTIGAADSAGRNIISGNDASGVSIIQSGNRDVAGNLIPASGNVISANFIGVDVTGNATVISGGFQTSPVGNTGSGVLINAAGNTVGGNRTTSATGSNCTNACNVIAGNRANGVSISSNFATGNVITGNNIGVGTNNTTSIGNRDNGIQISNLAASNTIGGTTTAIGFCNNACNIIANNGDPVNSTTARAGVYVDPTAAAGNAIRSNSIFNNTGLGIDLEAVGATGNDAMDPDTGANNQQNSPMLNTANNAGLIGGTFNSTPNTTFAIEFFRNVAPDTTMTSEARTFIGSNSVTTDNMGNALISFNSGATTLTSGQFVTATATSTGGSAQAIGDTSEISNAQIVVAQGGTGGLEADVATRPNGDNQILANDVNQMIRFLNEQDAPSTVPNEFQRADSAPFASRGNGVIDAADINQTIRYLNEQDALQPAGGPAAPSGALADSASSEQAVRQTVSESSSAALVAPELRVQSTSGRAGTQVSVNIRVDAVGNETQYAFAVQVDPNVLTFAGFAAGTAGATNVTCNTTATPGRIRCFAGAFPPSADGSIGEIGAGDNQLLLTLNFTIASGATANTTTAVSLNSQSASDQNSNTITPATTNGMVSILGPTAAATSIGGHVQNTAGGGLSRVTVLLQNTRSGETLITRTGADGRYVFENLEVGVDYIVTPRLARHTFSPASKFVTLTEELTDMDFSTVTRRTR